MSIPSAPTPMSLFFVAFLLLAASLAYKVAAFIIRRHLQATYTAVDDISFLSQPRKNGNKIPGTAVICGGSIAGLLSARVCSDHFEQVVIVDPEEWIASEEGLHDHHREANSSKRSRVPQYTSAHLYQPFTKIALEKFFPDFEREVQREGSQFYPADIMAHVSGVPLSTPWHQYPDGTLPKSMCITRPCYETVLRRLVLSTCKNIKYRIATAISLVPHRSLVNTAGAVVVRSHVGNETEIPASLVIDCTGPARGGLRWLQGFPFEVDSNSEDNSTPLSKLVMTYDHKMSYSTCTFDVPSSTIKKLNARCLPHDFETAAAFYLFWPNPQKTGSVFGIARQEKNFVQILCGGWNNRERMTNISDIDSFISNIISDSPIPAWISEMLKIFHEDDVPATYVFCRAPPPIYVPYHQAAQIPNNFIAIGDSVLLLNPIRGEGCTKACVEAVTLNAMLSRCVPSFSSQEAGKLLPDNFSRLFFAAQANRTGYLWESQKADDYAWSSTVPTSGDDRRLTGAWRRAYGTCIIQLATQDREVAAVLWHCQNWLAPQTDLFSPLILVKIAWMLLKREAQKLSRWNKLF